MTNDVLLRQLVERERRVGALAAELSAKDPTLGYSALIIAGDMISRENGDDALAAGSPFMYAGMLVGSFARFAWAIDAYERGAIAWQDLAPNLPDLWRDSDPDDTDPRFAAVWRRARVEAGRVITDADDVAPPTSPLTLYRGQDRGAPIGLSWSLDRATAVKFARGAGVRQASRKGVVLVGTCAYDDAFAYLTGRGEAEIVVDPAAVRIEYALAPERAP